MNSFTLSRGGGGRGKQIVPDLQFSHAFVVTPSSQVINDQSLIDPEKYSSQPGERTEESDQYGPQSDRCGANHR